MARLKPNTDTLRALFARSGNQCAFPGCSQALINSKNQFIGQVCHIEAANEGGERYNPDSTDEQRRNYNNLLILCYPHHIETNDVDEYPVNSLIEIKNEHEKIFEKSNFKIDESELIKLSYEMEKYWVDIERLNKVDHEHVTSGLSMEVNGDSNFTTVMASAYSAVDGIENLLQAFCESDDVLEEDFVSFLSKKGINGEIFNDIPYYENPFSGRNWEFHNIGTPNWLQRLRIDLLHIEVKYLEEYLKTNTNDQNAKTSFEKAKIKLKDYAKTARHID